jgi:AraC family transcriptional regulator
MNDDRVLRKFAFESVNSTLVEPGRTLLSSQDAGWNSVLLQVVKSPGSVEQFDTVATPDHLIVLVLEGSYDIQSISPRASKQARYRPGLGGMTAAMNTSRLRWSSTTHRTLQTLHLYLPQSYFAEAWDEYRPLSRSATVSFPDALGFADPLVFSTAKALAEAARTGAPDLYADGAARFLASHLTWKLGASPLPRYNANWELSDRRLKRAVEFMQAHFAQSLTLAAIAREAAMSPFHFARLFKSKTGMSPGHFLIELRMQEARNLLEHSDLSVSDIASSCGYIHAGHFAATFRKWFAQPPLAYRASTRADVKRR